MNESSWLQGRLGRLGVKRGCSTGSFARLHSFGSPFLALGVK